MAQKCQHATPTATPARSHQNILDLLGPALLLLRLQEKVTIQALIISNVLDPLRITPLKYLPFSVWSLEAIFFTMVALTASVAADGLLFGQIKLSQLATSIVF